MNCREIARKNAFLIVIICAMIMGIALGLGLRQIVPTLGEDHIMYLRFPGELFLRMLRMILIPLVVCSLIAAVTSVTPNSSGRMGIVSLVYYIGSTTLATVTSIAVCMLMKPGVLEPQPGDLRNPDMKNTSSTMQPAITDVLFDLARNLVPGNIFEATFQKDTTMFALDTISNKTGEKSYRRILAKSTGSNILGLITFSLFFGVIISKLGPMGRPLTKFFNGCYAAILKMITVIIMFAPVGIVSLIAATIVEIEDPVSVLSRLSLFLLAFFLTMGIHCFISLPAIVFGITRRNPFLFMLNMGDAFITMCSVASSAATLPVTIRCLVEKNKVDRRVVDFIAPVGTTVNMDGAAIYQASGAIFLAQYHGIELTVGTVVTIGLTAIAGSVGAAAMPNASLIAISIVLTAAGIPTDIGLLAAVDWLLDRCRGMCNILSDGFGAAIVEKVGTSDGKRLHRAVPTPDGEVLVETV